jgi:hypothetical protein
MSRVFGAAAFLVPLAVYWLTAAPGITLIDSGELALSAWDPGVAHPPGFPLYVLVGFLVARLPLAEPARNLNLLSAICGAASCWLVWMAARLIIRRRDWTANLAALTAALTFGFSFVLWGFTSFTEVYTLSLVMFGAAFVLLLQATDNDTPDPRLLLVSALFWALALSVHLGTVALTAPAFLYASLSAGQGERLWPDVRRHWRRLLAPAALVAGAAGLLYSTIAALAWLGPQFNWGDATSLARFLHHVSGKQYQSNLFSSSAPVILAELQRIGRFLLFQGTPAALLSALWGIAVLRRGPGRRLLVTLLLLVLFNIFYALAYEINEDKEAYYMVTFFSGALLMAVGTADLLNRLRGRRILLSMGVAVLVLVPLAGVRQHWDACDRSGDRRGSLLVRELCDPLPEGTLLLTGEWQFYSPWLYDRHVLGYRRDLRVVDVNLVRRSWYVNYLEQTMPVLMAATARQKIAFLDQLARFEDDRPYDPETIQRSFIAFFNGLIAAAHAQGAAVHTTIPMENGVGAGCTPVPRGLSFRLLPPGGLLPDPGETPILDGDRWVYGDQDLAGGKIKWLHGEMLYWAGRYHADQGADGRARHFLERAKRVHRPGTPYPGR